ncbi:hypothetical protein KC992_04950, partial [Candidatus Saccharibacteria bacterium]|nr:hypothetical protein [Candidatus Saccharibacteria bacterium]
MHFAKSKLIILAATIGIIVAIMSTTVASAKTICSHAVQGEILKKYNRLNGSNGFLGCPITDEKPTFDGIGRHNHFQHGSIFWHPDTGAYEVHGAIRERWKSLKWAKGSLGYPITDEMVTLDKLGRYNHFQYGSIYWYPQIGAYEVYDRNYYWTPWVSEENGGPSSTCSNWNDGAVGFECSGRFCDNVRLLCEAFPNKITLRSDRYDWTDFFSEEDSGFELLTGDPAWNRWFPWNGDNYEVC